MKRNSHVDSHVGHRLRMLRKMHQLSQAKLGEMMGLSHQQIQQYEIGSSRISAGTLYEITMTLGVSVTYFYEGIDSLSLVTGYNNSLSFERSTPLDILLIENNSSDEERFRKVLNDCKYDTNIHVERNGIDALEFLRGRRSSKVFVRPEIIVLNANVYKEDRYTVLKNIKNDRNLLDIPVIILTSVLDYDDVKLAYTRYASGFIRKSMDNTNYKENIELMIKYWSSAVLPSMQNS